MKLYPNADFPKVSDITIEFLNQNQIKALILDVDNTLIDYNQNLPKQITQWVEKLKAQNIKLYILSNSNKKGKIEKVAKQLDLPYQSFAKKPLRSGFKKVQKKLNEKPENIAIVGDQIFTDILGGNRSNMFTILVEPINPKDIWITMWKRPIEEKIKRNYRKEKNKGEK